MDDRIFQGRLRVVSIGELCELRLEESGRCCTDFASMLWCVSHAVYILVEPVDYPFGSFL